MTNSDYRAPTVAAVAFGSIAGATFIWLLTAGHIGEASFVALALPTLVAVLAVAAFPRLKELSLRDLRVTLREINEAQVRLEQTKAEIVEMYGGIENLRREPFRMDEATLAELGIGNGLTTWGAIGRYVAGCVTRERERLARIFVNQKSPEETATAILDGSLNANVFKWNGPEATLDAPPKSVQQKQAEKQARAQATTSG